MKRVYNFSAGPSMLPMPVLERAAAELVCYGDSGMSVMEMSHRSPEYEAIITSAQESLRKLMNIPDNYKILFLQGGASTQFASVCYNLLTGSGMGPVIFSAAKMFHVKHLFAFDFSAPSFSHLVSKHPPAGGCLLYCGLSSLRLTRTPTLLHRTQPALLSC